MKRVLFFIQNGMGGAERMTINIAKLLPRDKYKILFCKVNTPYIIQNGRIDDFIPKDFPLINISWSGQLSFLVQIYNVISKYSPDIVFSSVMPYNQRILLLQPFFKQVRFIVRNDNYLFTLSKFKRITLKYTYRRATKIIAQTVEMREELVQLGLPESKIIVIQNIIDEDLILEKASEESPFPEDATVRFVSVGRIAYQKGFDVLIKAFAEVKRFLPDAELYIIGSYTSEEKNLYEELQNLVRSLKLTSSVFFCGYQDNPYKYIKNASAYVLSSRYEGLPNVLIEAQFLNIPIVATSCIPVISRMVKNGLNGYLATPENPKSLADAMLKAAEMKTLASNYDSSSKDSFINLFE